MTRILTISKLHLPSFARLLTIGLLLIVIVVACRRSAAEPQVPTPQKTTAPFQAIKVPSPTIAATTRSTTTILPSLPVHQLSDDKPDAISTSPISTPSPGSSLTAQQIYLAAVFHHNVVASPEFDIDSNAVSNADINLDLLSSDASAENISIDPGNVLDVLLQKTISISTTLRQIVHAPPLPEQRSPYAISSRPNSSLVQSQIGALTPPSIIESDGVERTIRVPILMYHYTSVPPANADIYRLDLSVTPTLLAAHLDRIQAEGYTTISFYDLLAFLHNGTPLPERSVILTFDDGYRDNYYNALPLLVERNMTATIFVVTDFINEQRPGYVSWDMVREMHRSGLSIEAHSRNHFSLRNRDRDYLIWHALGNRDDIEREVGVRPRIISYPAGEYDQLTIEIFKSADYWAGITTLPGATHRSNNLFEIRRVRIRGTTTADELARLLALEW